MSDIWNERNFKKRKWTTGWAGFNKNPTPDSDDPMKQAKLTYERHTLICSKCSLFGLKSESQHRSNLFCSDGFKLMKRYRTIRVVWKHQHPDAYARSVVGGVLHSFDEKEKKEQDRKRDEAKKELNYNG